MNHIKNFKVKNKEDIKNFLKHSSIFSPHQLVTGNGLSSYDYYGKLFQQFGVFDDLANSIIDINPMPFLDMWANVNPPGTHVKPHDHFTAKHPNSVVGVYYLTKPINSGNLIIEDTEIEIDEDDLVLFNDVDTHWSQKNESTENRIAISFNMNHKHHYQQRPRNYEPTTNKSYT